MYLNLSMLGVRGVTIRSKAMATTRPCPLPRGIEGGRSSPSTGESTANLASSFRVSHRPRASRPRRRPPTVERVEYAPEEPRLGMDRTIDRRKSPRTLLIIIFDI